MKKILVSILALIYLSTSIGATVHLHFCMGKLLSWGFIAHESKDCDFCGMPKNADNNHCFSAKNGCCKDESRQIKTGGDQKISSSGLQLLNVFTQSVVNSHLGQADFRIPSLVIAYPVNHAPPLKGKVAVFLLNRNFRI